MMKDKGGRKRKRKSYAAKDKEPVSFSALNEI
jgi:hypothetical protein